MTQALFERLPVTLAADTACGVRVGRLRQWTAIERARTHERTAAQRTDGGTLGPTRMRSPWSPFQSTRQCFLRMASARASTAALAKPKTRGAAPTAASPASRCSGPCPVRGRRGRKGGAGRGGRARTTGSRPASAQRRRCCSPAALGTPGRGRSSGSDASAAWRPVRGDFVYKASPIRRRRCRPVGA